MSDDRNFEEEKVDRLKKTKKSLPKQSGRNKIFPEMNRGNSDIFNLQNIKNKNIKKSKFPRRS